MASEEQNKQHDVVAIDLPAPSGWVKKFTPKKGGTPQRHDIVFISPTGEEIKNKRQLDQYLKSHPGGPASSEFDWGTGDSPRRSARLSEKSKATEPPVSPSPKKKQRRSNTKVAKEKSDAEATDEKKDAPEETKESTDVPVADSKDAGNGEKNSNVEDVEMKTGTDMVLEEPSASKAPTDANNENADDDRKESNHVTNVVADAKIEESKETSNEVLDTKIEGSKETSNEVPDTKIEESKETSKEVLDTKIEESKETSKEVPDTKIEESKEASDESKEAYNEVPNTIVDETKDASNEVPVTNVDESKDASNKVPIVKVGESKEESNEIPIAQNNEPKPACAENKIPDGKVDNAEKGADQENLKEKPVEADPGLQETKTGS